MLKRDLRRVAIWRSPITWCAPPPRPIPRGGSRLSLSPWGQRLSVVYVPGVSRRPALGYVRDCGAPRTLVCVFVAGVFASPRIVEYFAMRDGKGKHGLAEARRRAAKAKLAAAAVAGEQQEQHAAAGKGGAEGGEHQQQTLTARRKGGRGGGGGGGGGGGAGGGRNGG